MALSLSKFAAIVLVVAYLFGDRALAAENFDLKLDEKVVADLIKFIQSSRAKLKDKDAKDTFPIPDFCSLLSDRHYRASVYVTPRPIPISRVANRKTLSKKEEALVTPLLEETAAYMSELIRLRLGDDSFAKKSASSTLGNALACLRYLDHLLGQSQLPNGYERTVLQKVSSNLLQRNPKGGSAKQSCDAVCETLAEGKPLSEITRLDANDRGSPLRVVTETLDAWWTLEASIACPEVKSGADKVEKALKTWSEGYKVFQKNSFAAGHKFYAYANYFNGRLLSSIARNETREKPPVKLIAENILGKAFDKRAALENEQKQLARYTQSWEKRKSEKPLGSETGRDSGLENFSLGTFLAVLPETREKLQSDLKKKIDKKEFREKETSDSTKQPTFMPYSAFGGSGPSSIESWLSSANRGVPWALVHYVDHPADNRDELLSALERYTDASPALVDALMQYEIAHAETLDRLANYYFGPSIFQAHASLALLKRSGQKMPDADRKRLEDVTARLQAVTLLAYRGKGVWASEKVDDSTSDLALAASGYNRAFFVLGLVTACTEGRALDAEFATMTAKDPSTKSGGSGKSH